MTWASSGPRPLPLSRRVRDGTSRARPRRRPRRSRPIGESRIPWEEKILEWAAEQLLPIRIADALEQLGIRTEDHDQARQKRVGAVLRANGYERARRRIPGER